MFSSTTRKSHLMIPKKIISTLLAGLLLLGFTFGRQPDRAPGQKVHNKRTSDLCSPSSSSIELDINNVRCLLHNGGDMWWDLTNNPRYEVPKVDNPAERRHSSFAGSLWIGGVDDSKNLRVAAATYRQNGNDFFPGPLTSEGEVTEATCETWDRHFKITKAELDAFRADFEEDGEVDLNQYPVIRDWPAFWEDTGTGDYIPLAPYYSASGNNFAYDPANGDYPDIRPDPQGSEPDMAIWWVINDKGNIHTETGGSEIGLEVRTMAFAYSTANAINDMTFYKYQVVNRASSDLNDTYIGQWVDSDIGLASNDYVGCDIERGLGYCYNGEATDPGPNGYGSRPPAFGLDFFQGPLADGGDGIDNDKNGIIDEPGERWGMSKFVYYNNDFTLNGNPEVASHYYGYLTGHWKDGSPIVDNGQDGYPGTASGPEASYMFPGLPTDCSAGPRAGWTENTAGNDPGDRRFLISAGPFTLNKGSHQDIIVGAVWARGDDYLSSVCELLEADQIAQVLFDNHFQLLDGPDAPNLAVEEFDQELILSWGYDGAAGLRNNANESYRQADPVLESINATDPTFEFEGYMVFQLKDASVSSNELFDTERARQVYQCDVRNGITSVVNRTVTGTGNTQLVVDELMVDGQDDGISRSVRLTEDLFAPGADSRLTNYKTYYYGVIAYAHNDTSSDGRKFVPSNRFFKNTTAVPHPINFENFGTVVNSEYGDHFPLTQIAGFGNGGQFVELDGETELDILANGSTNSLTYRPGKAPIQVSVVNPKLIKDAEYKVEVVGRRFTGQAETVEVNGQTTLDSVFAEWILLQKIDNRWQEIYEATYIQSTAGNRTTFRPEPMNGTERLIEGHGLAISVENQIAEIDSSREDINPFIGASMRFLNPAEQWLSGMPDLEEIEDYNWLQDGFQRPASARKIRNDAGVYDRYSFYGNILNGSWGPWCLAKTYRNDDTHVGLGFNMKLRLGADGIDADSVIQLTELPDVDLVITSNPDKWSKCVVVESSPAQVLGSGAWPMTGRWANSVDQKGKPTPGGLSKENSGMGWFPGYAINVNTGERLNVFFAESSWDFANRGNDMVWNPTSQFGADNQPPLGGVPTRVGGRHYVFISNTPYDECKEIHKVLANGVTDENGIAGQQAAGTQFHPSGVNFADLVYRNVAWAGVPMLANGYDFSHPSQIPSPVRISLRNKQAFGPRKGQNDHPIFTFDTGDYHAIVGDQSTAEKSLMEEIRIVPNPYYAYSEYEKSQLQTIVKITNLPQKCKVRIYTLNGTLIRTYNKDSDEPHQDWDLKNHAGVPVASGVYLIHVDGFELGEKIMKFFGVLPALDLSAY